MLTPCKNNPFLVCQNPFRISDRKQIFSKFNPKTICKYINKTGRMDEGNWKPNSQPNAPGNGRNKCLYLNMCTCGEETSVCTWTCVHVEKKQVSVPEHVYMWRRNKCVYLNMCTCGEETSVCTWTCVHVEKKKVSVPEHVYMWRRNKCLYLNMCTCGEDTSVCTASLNSGTCIHPLESVINRTCGSFSSEKMLALITRL